MNCVGEGLRPSQISIDTIRNLCYNNIKLDMQVLFFKGKNEGGITKKNAWQLFEKT